MLQSCQIDIVLNFFACAMHHTRYGKIFNVLETGNVLIFVYDTPENSRKINQYIFRKNERGFGKSCKI